MTTSDTDSKEASSPKKGLAARLQSAAAEDEAAVKDIRKRFETVMEEELSALGSSSRELCKRVLRTIEDDIRRDAGNVARLTSRLWKHLLWYGAIASVALYVGLWAPLHWQSKELGKLEEESERLRSDHRAMRAKANALQLEAQDMRMEILDYRLSIAVLKKKAGGIQVRGFKGKAWVYLPKRCRKDKPCVRLPDDWLETSVLE